MNNYSNDPIPSLPVTSHPERELVREKTPIQEKVGDDYQESMQEDMRGPFEGMEEVPPAK